MVQATNLPLPVVAALAGAYAEHGDHPEIVRFKQAAPRSRYGSINVWNFIEDTIHGRGGYADGSYLIPHKREWETPTFQLNSKFLDRVENADYDNFARTIAETPWAYISQSSHLVTRDAAGFKELEEWWTDVDGNGTDIMDFLEYPAEQARMYGTAWVFLDRSGPVSNLAEDESAETRPYLYCVPTRNVVYWSFDRRKRLSGLVVCESEGEVGGPEKIRVWTRDGWGLFELQGKEKKSPAFIEGGTSDLGEIPVVTLYDQRPAPGKALGKSIMLSVAKIARTVYNLESEAREIERRCAFPFLAMSMKDASPENTKKVRIGTDSLLAYDGGGGEPRWITPDLTSHDKIRERIREKKEAAFSTAHMKGVMGHTSAVETSSGFHSQVEFDETNRQISKFAASLEASETQIARLYCSFRGKRDAKVSINYPRDFGFKDIATTYQQTQQRIDLNLGFEDTAETIFDLYCALYPRRAKAELKTKAETAAREHVAAQGAARTSSATPQERAREILSRTRQGKAAAVAA